MKLVKEKRDPSKSAEKTILLCIMSVLSSLSFLNVAAQEPEQITIDSAYLTGFFNDFEILKDVHRQTNGFYNRHDWKLVWFEGQKPIPQALMLVNTLENLARYGLVGIGQSMHLVDSLALLNSETTAFSKAASTRWFDVALTALYFEMFPKFWNGELDPRSTNEIEWHIAPPRFSYAHVLDSILGGKQIENPFIDFRKFHPGFFHLKNLLTRLSVIEQNGGWKALEQKRLMQGSKGPDVAALAQRLSISGDFTGQHTDSTFSRRLKEAVKKFQRRHGLLPDGILGPETLKALNVTVEERIKQTIVNMERWRWLEPINSTKYIFVNIPEYQLYAFNNGVVELEMPVIVGKEASQTVIFKDEVKYIVVNPYWNIPKSIAVKEMLPKVKKDHHYLADRQIEVGIQGNYENLNQDTIDWATINAETFAYTFRQRPGRHNQLGTIKFIFPNKYSIYLHDTPSRRLFRRIDRRLSHGCVRVGEPYRLAEFLLKDHSSYSGQKIKRITKTQHPEDLWITINNPVSVYLVYFTAWVDADGTAHFRDDIYGHDAAMKECLFLDPDSS